MVVLKCKMCGGALHAEQGMDIIECKYCGSVQTIPKLDDELKIKMYERANDLRIMCDFDQAAIIFQNIVSQFPDEAEAYWGLVLCKYGIEYVDDPATFAKIPTCHRTQAQSIFDDINYLSACENAPLLKWKYEEEAKAIDSIQKRILNISATEEPYDIFICYKETDDVTRNRTEDSFTAQDIYTELVKNGYRVFYSRVSLRGKAGSEYEPYIYAALSSARVMLVIGSHKEYFNAVWLKNEWSRFLGMMSDSQKVIIPCYEKIAIEDLPAQLRGFQALDMGNKIFFNDLLTSIQRIIPKEKRTETNKESRDEGNVDFSAKPTRKEMNYDDGVYVGAALGNRPHGFGTRFFTNGNKYEGNWEMGVKHGQGTFHYDGAGDWTGEWRKNAPWNGSGVYVFESHGSTMRYEGKLVNGLLTGQCKIFRNNNLESDGEFFEGKLNGRGKHICKSKFCEGEFKNGRPWNAQGPAVLQTKKPAYFDGTWINGQPHGNGVVNFLTTNERIEGKFSNGLNGEVKWSFASGRHYEGQIVNGVLCGNGIMFDNDGAVIYKGEFASGLANGKGTMFYKGKGRYEGEMKDGKCHGQGTYYSAKGNWSGEWKNGLRWNGQGINFLVDKNQQPNGNLLFGPTVNGKFNGKVTIICTDGTRFDGNMVNGVKNGVGTLKSHFGTWSGEWKDNQMWNGQGVITFYDKGKPTGKSFKGKLYNGKANGPGVLILPDGTRFDGDFYDDKYYNGNLVNTKNNTLIDSFVNGVSQNEKNRQLNDTIASTALGILSIL